jgi:nitroimidazol reductase NimA-like FMN-containing flavoprotein (pyridoxamine 5'-phosphate oxidase superfamily)
MTQPGSTERTRIKRVPERAITDINTRNEILDLSVLAHVAIADESGQPFVIPMGFARDGERLLLHGSAASRLMKILATGTKAAVEVTILDGLVFARSAFESSMNYRSVIAFGSAKLLTGDEKEVALEILTEKLFPGRSSEVRPMKPDEVKATIIVEFPLTETSVKIRSGPHDDRPEDLALPIWAGVLPLTKVALDPIAGDENAEKIAVPQSVKNLMVNPPQS